jgi:lipopolysaccharide export system ATP-binding protein
VLISDRDVTELPMCRRARLGVSYSAGASVFRRLTVERTHGVLELLGIPWEEGDARWETSRGVRARGLQAAADTLSGGRRRLEIARPRRSQASCFSTSLSPASIRSPCSMSSA